MNTLTNLTKACQDKGLDLHQNLSVGKRKIYAVTLKGSKRALDAGYLVYISKFVKDYNPADKPAEQC